MRYFDLHCDTMTECSVRRRQLKSNHLHVALDRAARYRPWAQFFAIWTPDDVRGTDALRRFNQIYDTFRTELRSNAAQLAFCANADDLEAAFAGGKAACLLSIEGSAGIDAAPDAVGDAYARGVRMATLTWNGACKAGDGCMVKNAGGLTPFGKELVRRMDETHMLIDVSHLSPAGFDDVAALVGGPFLASHSNSRAVCGHPRNLTDGQFRTIAERGGLVGLNLYPAFLRDDGKASVSDLLRHTEHFLALGGENVLAVGADFDGAVMPAGIHGIEDMEKVYMLLADAYSEALADKIFFENARRFFLRALGNCGRAPAVSGNADQSNS